MSANFSNFIFIASAYEDEWPFLSLAFSFSQYVFFKGTASPALNVTCGVPQGSILGPILFLLYLNDLAMISSKLKFILFADDTNAFLSHKSLDKLFEIMNAELQKMLNGLT